MKSDLPERTFEFAKGIVGLCRQLDVKAGVPRTMLNQLLRAGTSIGANVEEGQGSQSKADFISKYSIACKEARETHYWLRLILATELLKESQINPLIEECNELIAILTSILRKLRARKETA